MKCVVSDAGDGQRLGAAARNNLLAAIRAAAAERAGALLFVVEGAAWDHAPEINRISDADLAPSRVMSDLYGLAMAFLKAETPVVVYVNGPVTGLGLGLTAAADVRVASNSASFALGEPRAAALLVSGGTWIVSHALGHGRLSSLAWTGSDCSARDALACGFVSQLHDSIDDAEALAEDVARMSSGAQSAMKRAMNARRISDLTEQLAYESWLVQVALGRTLGVGHSSPS